MADLSLSGNDTTALIDACISQYRGIGINQFQNQAPATFAIGLIAISTHD
jgi:hypothetical protein